MSIRFLLTIIFVCLAVFIGYFLVWPEYQKVLASQIEIENVKLKIDQNEEYFSRLKEIDNQLEKNKDKLAIVDSVLPDEFYLPHLFYALREMVIQNNLGFGQIDVSINPLKESERIYEIRISLDISGSYSDFKEFLSYLQHSARFFTVNNISINPSLIGESFNFNLAITTFSYK